MADVIPEEPVSGSTPPVAPPVTPPVSPSPVPVVTPTEKPKMKKNVLLIVTISAALFFVFAGAILAWVYFQSKYAKDASQESGAETEMTEDTEEEISETEEDVEEEDIEEETAEADIADDEEEPTPSPAPVATDQDRIIYIKNDNIWVANNDGTGIVQITSDASDTVRYRAIGWRSPGVISYSRCEGECKVYTKDLSTTVVSEILTGIPFTQNIDAIEWSHDGQTLGYIFTKGDYSKEARLWTAGGETVLESYAPPPGRGGHYDDGQYLEFSPDDSLVLVLNTIIDPAFNSPVMLFEIDGTMVAELADVTFPTFDGNDAFYYKSATGDIARYDITAGTSSVVTTFATSSIHNLYTSPDEYFVLFWSDVGGASWTQAYYDTGGSSSTIATDYVTGQWLDSASQYIVAVEVTGTGIMGNYESGGISKVRRTDGTATVIDTGDIYWFEVE